MRPLLAVLIAAAWLAAAAPATSTFDEDPAPGTLVASPVFVPEAGPLLAGDAGVVWLRRRDDAVLDLWEADGAGARHVQRFVAADGERLRVTRLTATSTEVALELLEGVARRTYAGAFGRPLVAAPLAALPAGIAGVRFTDADEHRTVFVARGCRSAQIRTVALPLAAPITRREPTCRLRLRERARLRGERLRFGLSCAGLRIDCAARVVVRAGGRVIARGGASYNHATPPFAAASLRVTPAGLRLLRRNPRTRVRISARFGELAPRRATVVARR